MGKFKEFINEKENKYQIYLDMDGVLTDFLKAYDNLNDVDIKTAEKKGDDFFWSIVDKGGLDFWAKMPWMPDGKKLFNFVKKYNPKILSAPARRLPNSPKGKKIWVKREIPSIELILRKADKKKEFANKNSILIDDLEKNIKAWENAGGIGIHHKSTLETIKKLKNIFSV